MYANRKKHTLRRKKTMSEKTKAFMDRAKTQTIGCEIEMAEITRNMAIKTVARYFGTLDTVHHDGGAYDAWSCKKNRNL